MSRRSKYIDVYHDFCLHRVRRGEIQFNYCPSTLNLADFLTAGFRHGPYCHRPDEVAVALHYRIHPGTCFTLRVVGGGYMYMANVEPP